MTHPDEAFVHAYANNMPPNSKRSLPAYSQFGRGPKGDSALLAIDDSEADNPKFVGTVYNWYTDETHETFELPLMNLVPKLHYQVWRGVREIDELYHWGYYVRFSCDIMIDNSPHVFWTFDTPFAITGNFYGATPPADYIIDEG